MILGPLCRRSQDYGIVPDVDLPTEELTNWLDQDYRYVKKLDQLAQDVFNRTKSADLISDALINYLQKTLVDGSLKLGAPYEGLALITLNDVNWDTVVAPFVAKYEGPQYLDEAEEENALFDYFDRALQEIPGELPSANPKQPSAPLPEWTPSPEWTF